MTGLLRICGRAWRGRDQARAFASSAIPSSQCADVLQRYIDIGCTHFACRDTYMTMRLGASIAGFADRRRPQPRSPQRCDELIAYQARTHTPYLVALASSHASREMIFGADETTTVQLKRGENRGEHSSVRANDSKRVGGSSRTQNLFSHLRLVSDPIRIFRHSFGRLCYPRPKYGPHLWRLH